MAALLRLIGARLPGSELALYGVSDARIRLAAATGGFARPDADRASSTWRTLDPPLARLIARGLCARIDPAVCGLAARFCAAQPLRGRDETPIGVLLVSDARPRRLGAGMLAALADAAEIAAPLLAAVADQPAADSLPAAGGLPGDTPRARGDAVRSVLLLDLDRNPAGEPVLGAAAADTLLEAVEARLGTCLRPGDQLARLEGDRFVVLTARPRTTLAGFAAGLLAAARQPISLAGRPVVIGASIGVSAALALQSPPWALPPQEGAAQRRTRREGRTRFAGAEPPRAGARQQGDALERDLAEATARGQMRLVYQGYIDLANGQVSGVEALLRWRHPIRGELAPAAFIPLAEASGLILPLGAWALRTALAAAARWPQHLALSVNVSALQFHQPGFVAEIEAALAVAGVAAERLELEITETVLMRDNPATKAQLRALIARGVRIALDDFGTGYSALAYLGRLPHHRIKLDRAFVQDLRNPATLELVRAILALAQKSGVAVTAEGVERPDQLRLVRALGFTHAQGYLTGPPVEDPAALLAEPQPAF